MTEIRKGQHMVVGEGWIKEVVFVWEKYGNTNRLLLVGDLCWGGGLGALGIHSHHGKQEVKTHSNQQAQKQKSAYL